VRGSFVAAQPISPGAHTWPHIYIFDRRADDGGVYILPQEKLFLGRRDVCLSGC
jgi:hypothetical protein